MAKGWTEEGRARQAKAIGVPLLVFSAALEFAA
jgi:hypothetical protein